jgi:muramoyltetrapeptide carboxypeptidase
MSSGKGLPVKPKKLLPGARIAPVAPASPAQEAETEAGLNELKRLGFSVQGYVPQPSEGYFAASCKERRREFLQGLASPNIDGLIALRGGYGSAYLLEDDLREQLGEPKCLVGYSDITSLQAYLWQRCGWVSFYGPMIAAGFDAGAGKPGGYDEASFLRAVSETNSGWTLDLQGEAMLPGEAQGRVLGGCLTILEATIGTPWALDINGAILLLEDRAMKPYQVDRVLMHLKQAGMFGGVRGIILGDFPECAPPVAGSWTVADVCRRLLQPLGIPVIWGAPVGHTERAILTLPLGVRARLRARGTGTLDLLEPAVMA